MQGGHFVTFGTKKRGRPPERKRSNSITFRKTILFDPTTDPAESGIEKRCEIKCGGPMRLLLARIAKRFPNARIVVPGYYPFFSDQSPKMTLRFVTWLFLLMAKTGGEPHGGPEAADHMIRKSAVWYEISNRTLQEAVEESGREEDVSGRVVFTPVPFLAENAYGAPNSLIWAITEHDNVASSRSLGRMSFTTTASRP
jgi:hypothetical protein